MYTMCNPNSYTCLTVSFSPVEMVALWAHWVTLARPWMDLFPETESGGVMLASPRRQEKEDTGA